MPQPSIVRTLGYAALTPVAAVLLWKSLAQPDVLTVWQARAINGGAVMILAAFLLHEAGWLLAGYVPPLLVATAIIGGWSVMQPEFWPWAASWWTVQAWLVLGWLGVWNRARLAGSTSASRVGFGMTLISAVGLLVGVVTRLLWGEAADPHAPALRGSTADLAGAGWIEVALPLACIALICAIITSWRGA